MTLTLPKGTEKFDRLELQIQLLGPYPNDSREAPAFLITQSILINGKDLAPDNPIDLIALAKSCQIDGEHFIATCGCGDHACAFIDHGIHVHHEPDRIVWDVPEPISYRDLTDDEAESRQARCTYRRFQFRPAAYMSAIRRGLRIAKAYVYGECQPVDCSPHGFEPEDLLKLDPLVFSDRGAPCGCQIVAPKVFIDREPSSVTINGIVFRLSELPLPAEVKRLDDWSAWEPKPSSDGNGYFWNYAAAPDWELRRRLRILGDALAAITQVGGEVNILLGDRGNSREIRHEKRLILRGRAPRPIESIDK